MKIYLVERTDGYGYEDYDSFVIIAENEEQAKNADPCSVGGEVKLINWKEDRYSGSWVSQPDKLKVTYLGTNEFATKPMIVCASFNAS